MMKVAVNRIVSVTEARTRLSELVDEASADAFWVLTKGGKPRVALVDVAYLDELIRKAWFNDLTNRSATAFEIYLREQGLNSTEMSDTEIEALLEA